MFPDKFLKPHWLVPRNFFYHLIGSGENTWRMILRDFKDMLCKEWRPLPRSLQPPLTKCFKRYSFVGDFMSQDSRNLRTRLGVGVLFGTKQLVCFPFMR